MKTLNNIWDDVISIPNLTSAHHYARKGKSKYRSVKSVNRNETKIIKKLHDQLKSGSYRTSSYEVETRMCGDKERVLHKLPYYPDRIAHRAFLNLVEPTWTKSYIRDTFQSIKGRGTSDCFRRVKKGVQEGKPKFGRKLDIVKFYPNLAHSITLNPNLYRIKDTKALDFLFEIIQSLPFLPLGNSPSQPIGNLTITPLDWFCKQQLKIRYYYRYCDDIVFLSDSEEELDNFQNSIQGWLWNLGLDSRVSETINLSSDYLDFVGFRINHRKILLRKSISAKFKQAVKSRNYPSLASYYGWCKTANAQNLYHSNVRKIV